MKTNEILIAARSSDRVEFEFHDSASEVSLNMYWTSGRKDRSQTVAKACVANESRARAYYKRWLAELRTIWSKNKIESYGRYAPHDTLYGIRLSDGKREDADFPRLKKQYTIAAVSVMICAGKRFESEEMLDLWMKECRADYARVLRKFIKTARPDLKRRMLMIDISTGAPEQSVPVLVSK